MYLVITLYVLSIIGAFLHAGSGLAIYTALILPVFCVMSVGKA